MFRKKTNSNPNDIQNTITGPITENLCPVFSSDTEISDKPPKKKKGKKIAVISGITAVTIAGGTAAAYLLSPLVRNQINLRIMKPKKYYVWVNEENSQSFAEKASEKYEESLQKYKKGSYSSIDLKFDAEDAAREFLLKEAFSDPEITPEGKEIVEDMINNIESFGISLSNDSKKTDDILTLSANLNGESLLSLELAVDMLVPQLFMRYPEIKEQWIGFDFGDIIEQTMDFSGENLKYGKIIDFYREVISDPSELISPKELKNAINNYTRAWNDSISDVDRSRSEEVCIGDIGVKYTVLDIDMSSRLGIKIIKNFIKEASNSKVIKRTIVDKLGLVSEQEYGNAFKAALSSVKMSKTDDDELFSLKTYIDSQGTVRGFSLDDGETEIFYAMGMHKDVFAIEFSVSSEGTKMIDLSLNANEKSKEKYSGSLNLSIDEEIVSAITDSNNSEDYNICMKFSDMSIGDKDNLKFTGDAELHIPDIDPIELKFKGKGDTQSVYYSLSIDGEKLGDASVSYTVKNGSSFDMPDPDDAKMMDFENMYKFNINEYFTPEDYLKFAEELYIKFGLDPKLARKIVEQSALDDNFGYDPDVF